MTTTATPATLAGTAAGRLALARALVDRADGDDVDVLGEEFTLDASFPDRGSTSELVVSFPDGRGPVRVWVAVLGPDALDDIARVLHDAGVAQHIGRSAAFDVLNSLTRD